MASEERPSDFLAAFAYRESALEESLFQSLIAKYRTANQALTFVLLGMDRHTGQTHAADQLRKTALPMLAESRAGAYLSMLSQPHPSSDVWAFINDPNQRQQATSIITPLTEISGSDTEREHQRQRSIFAFGYFAHSMGFWAQSGLLKNSDNPLGIFPSFIDQANPDTNLLFNIDSIRFFWPTSTVSMIYAIEQMEAFIKQATTQDPPDDLTVLPGSLLTQVCFTIGSNPFDLAKRFHQQQFVAQKRREENR